MPEPVRLIAKEQVLQVAAVQGADAQGYRRRLVTDYKSNKINWLPNTLFHVPYFIPKTHAFRERAFYRTG